MELGGQDVKYYDYFLPTGIQKKAECVVQVHLTDPKLEWIREMIQARLQKLDRYDVRKEQVDFAFIAIKPTLADSKLDIKDQVEEIIDEVRWDACAPSFVLSNIKVFVGGKIVAKLESKFIDHLQLKLKEKNFTMISPAVLLVTAKLKKQRSRDDYKYRCAIMKSSLVENTLEDLLAGDMISLYELTCLFASDSQAVRPAIRAWLTFFNSNNKNLPVEFEFVSQMEEARTFHHFGVIEDVCYNKTLYSHEKIDWDGTLDQSNAQSRELNSFDSVGGVIKYFANQMEKGNMSPDFVWLGKKFNEMFKVDSQKVDEVQAHLSKNFPEMFPNVTNRLYWSGNVNTWEHSHSGAEDQIFSIAADVYQEKELNTQFSKLSLQEQQKESEIENFLQISQAELQNLEQQAKTRRESTAMTDTSTPVRKEVRFSDGTPINPRHQMTELFQGHDSLGESPIVRRLDADCIIPGSIRQSREVKDLYATYENHPGVNGRPRTRSGLLRPAKLTTGAGTLAVVEEFITNPGISAMIKKAVTATTPVSPPPAPPAGPAGITEAMVKNFFDNQTEEQKGDLLKQLSDLATAAEGKKS